MFCQNGQDKVDLIDIWKIGSIIVLTFNPRSSFRGNYHGNKLRMGAFFMEPNIYVVSENGDGSDILDGLHYRLNKVIADALNAELQ